MLTFKKVVMIHKCWCFGILLYYFLIISVLVIGKVLTNSVGCYCNLSFATISVIRHPFSTSFVYAFWFILLFLVGRCFSLTQFPSFPSVPHL